MNDRVIRVIRVGNAYEPPEARAWRAMFPQPCVTEQELRAALAWLKSQWWGGGVG